MKVKYGFFLIVLVLLAFNIFPAYAVDELVLGGVVRNIDYKGKIITVDVKSGSCPGLKRFMVDDIPQMDSALIGKKIVFAINSSDCKEDRIYKIMVRKGEKHEE